MPSLLAWARLVVLVVLSTFNSPGYALRSSPLTLLVGFAPRSSTEIASRLIAAHPAWNVEEFIAWSRANPCKANFGTLAAGSLAHFTGVMLSEHVHVDMVHVACIAPAALDHDLLGGRFRPLSTPSRISLRRGSPANCVFS